MQSGSRRHRGEAGGGWFVFPPLLATDGRIHKGDCDMRTGAIFARGSCRALKWLALFGVVFALGAGSAAAQDRITLSGNTEGTIVDLTLTLASAVTSDTTVTFSVGTTQNPNTPRDETSPPYVMETNEVTFRTGRDTVVVKSGSTTATVSRALDLAEDDDAEDEYFSIEASGSGITNFNSYHMVADPDNQTYPLVLTNGTGTLENPSMAEEHAATPAPTLTLTAKPLRSIALTDITFEINPSAPRQYTLGTRSGANLGNSAGDSVTVTITAGNDGNRYDEYVTVTAYTTPSGGSKEELSSIEIKVEDAHTLPVIVGRWTDSTGTDWSSQNPSLDEGDEIYLKLIAAEETTLGGQIPVLLNEDVSITLTPGSPGLANSADYTLAPAGEIEIESGKSESSPIKLTLAEDADTAAEVLSFDATAAGESANGTSTETTNQVLSLTINGTDPPAALTFGSATQDDISATVGTALTDVALPAASGGTGDISYTTTTLPAGLTFAAATRTISGTPTGPAGTTAVTYTATDSATPTAASVTLEFDIVVAAAGTTPPTGAAPTFLSASFEPGSGVVTITMSERVWGGGDEVLATHFTIQGDATNAAVSHTVPRAASGASAMFDVTFSNAFSTGQPPTVVYTAPATNVGGHIVDTDNNRLASGTQAATETDILPMLPDLATLSQNLRKGVLITPIQLPEVIGGAAEGSNGTVAYSTGALPEGLSFNATTRQITGTPTMVTDGAMAITYIAVDNDANITPSTPDTATGSFTLTVQDAPDTPDAPTVQVTPNTSGSLDVTWTAPKDNNSPITDYEVQHRAVGDATWMHTRDLGTRTSRTFPGLTNGTTYEFQVRARNAIDWSGWSEPAEGVPMLSGALPDVPDAPTVTTAKTQGALDVSWKAPNSNGSNILDYGLRYRVQGSADWTVKAAVTGTSTTLSGLPASRRYEVQVRARNANGSSDWSKSGVGTTAAAPVAPTVRGQITSMKMMSGSSARNLTEVDRIVVGGPDRHGHNNRYHVREGDNDKWLQVEVQWTHEEIAAIGYSTAQTVLVEIMADRHLMPLPIRGVNWVSWIDDEGDADFPQGSTLGRLTAQVTVRTPSVGEVEPYAGSSRHVKAKKGQVRVLLPVDQHEAENDAFYIEATGGDVDLDATAAMNLTTPVVIIEDLTPQNVTVRRKRGEPTVIYEGAPSPASSTVAGQAFYTVSASPPRIDLPLQVRLDLTDPEGAVRTGDVSMSHSAVTLNPNLDGTLNSQNVYLALPIPDGNRVDDEYTLQASVVDYSLTSGGEDNTVSPASIDITVYDRHKIPTIHMVNPAMQSVAEGDTVDITVTVNRNPADTVAYNSEVLRYTNEELEVTLSPERSEDFRITTNPVKIAEHNRKAPWTQKATFTIEAINDDDVDMDTVTFDVEIAGTVAANGSETREMEEAATVNITDETEKLVWAKTADEVDAAVDAAIANAAGADGLNPREVVEILGAELFDALPGIVVDYSAASSDTAVATGSGSDRRMITVTPMAEGMAMVTVTATATSANGATIVDQTKPNVAQIMFSVDVVLQDLTFTVTGPDEMNLAEGGMGGMVKVTTNRPVTENTEVMLMRDGSSSAGDTDYELNPPLVTIMAGATEGATMVTAVEDNMAEDMEMLTLFLVVDGMQMTDKSVSFYIWDAAVPALPVIAQLLLAAFLAVGGYRRYRRR